MVILTEAKQMRGGQLCCFQFPANTEGEFYFYFETAKFITSIPCKTHRAGKRKRNMVFRKYADTPQKKQNQMAATPANQKTITKTQRAGKTQKTPNAIMTVQFG